MFVSVLTLIMLGYLLAMWLFWRSLGPEAHVEIDESARVAADDLKRRLGALIPGRGGAHGARRS